MPTKSENTSAVKSYAGIPEAQFIDDVDVYLKEMGEDVNVGSVLQKFEEQHQKYRFMESNLLAKKKRLKDQLPDNESSLKIIGQLQKQRDAHGTTNTHFLLSDQVYAQASVPAGDTVLVWLGAGCMLEYPLDEAARVLGERSTKASGELTRVDHDIDFLRDQLTTVQVNIARVYNWDVKRRQAIAAAKVTSGQLT